MSGGNQQTEPGMFMVLVAICLFIAGYTIWHFFKIPILEVLRYVRIGEVWMVHFIDHSLTPCIDWLRYAKPDDKNPSNEIIQIANACFTPDYLASVQQKDPKGKELLDYFMLSAPAMALIEYRAATYIRWIFVVFFGVMGIYVLYYSPRGKFRTKHTLESFIKLQADMWPVISPIVKFNPIKSSGRIPGSMVPDKLPLFAEALSPEEWVAWHRIPLTNNVADREAARRAFIMQLGPRWNGLDGQPDHIRSLFAAYALKGAQKREDSDDLLGRLSLCWSSGGGLKLTPELHSEIRKIIKDPDVGGKALEIADKHAWRTTAMMGVLKWGRNMGGVLAPAQFLWLRGTDRNLWYALNNLGRRSHHSEGAGAMSHFMTEQNAGKALPIPRIDTALVTLNQYLADSNRPIPKREEPSAGSRA
jgi:intracellular multiplication protein IcmP